MENATEEKRCYRCKHFKFKFLLNGYHGICDKRRLNEFSYTRFSDTCEDWEVKDDGER
jgi:hypothetical protein